MKVDDSGMPEEAYWNSLFDMEAIIEWLELSPQKASLVEIGCGYGTFTVPIAERHLGKIHAFDIEPAMLGITEAHTRRQGLSNVTFEERDVLEQGTGLGAESTDLVLLFNILHFAERRLFIQEASRILKKGGVMAILHWRKDIPTPRSPALHLRPDQAQILEAAKGLGLLCLGKSRILEPYHWGIQLIKA